MPHCLVYERIEGLQASIGTDSNLVGLSRRWCVPLRSQQFDTDKGWREDEMIDCKKETSEDLLDRYLRRE